jgi:hypothetical protein
MNSKLFIAAALAFLPLVEEASANGTFYGFIDTYYNWDFNPAKSRVRNNTTQPLKHDTFSTNLAMVGYKLEKDSIRSVLTLQAGDSVDTNYAPESKHGQAVKHFQEAYVGLKAGDIWIDAGIYLGHIGNESWASGHNWNYSRSLQLDYVPYYTSGVRFSGKHGKNDWQFHVMNGWQRINEDNHGKAVGTSYVWNLDGYTITYNTQIGQEVKPGTNTSGLRTYQNLHWDVPGKIVDWRMAVDLGSQNVAGKEKAVLWGATSSQWRYRFDEKLTFASRLEYFHDARGGVNYTGKPGNFRVAGASVNGDYKFENGVTLRMELRHLQAADPIYENGNHATFSDTFYVTSLSYMF